MTETLTTHEEILEMGLAVGSGLAAGFLRSPRQRCTSCGKRRVLFQVRLVGTTPDGHAVTLGESPRVCANCANLRV